MNLWEQFVTVVLGLALLAALVLWACMALLALEERRRQRNERIRLLMEKARKAQQAANSAPWPDARDLAALERRTVRRVLFLTARRNHGPNGSGARFRRVHF